MKNEELIVRRDLFLTVLNRIIGGDTVYRCMSRHWSGLPAPYVICFGCTPGEREATFEEIVECCWWEGWA